MSRKIRIFDTTLRDGEQCPGASMTAEQKLEVAHQLARLKVDVIEAGFPISSPGDFESVRQMAVEAVKRAKSHVEDVEFSPEDAARSDIEYLCRVVEAVIKAGATTINIPD